MALYKALMLYSSYNDHSPTSTRYQICHEGGISRLQHVQICFLYKELSVYFSGAGHLLITPAGETAIEGSKLYIAEINDIPTASELQLECPRGSDKLSVRFQRFQSCIICINFIWESS
jgi:hypothetical protein